MKLNEVKEKLTQTQNHYKEQLNGIKTGTASSGMVENIKVEAYEGSQLTIKELATISIPNNSLIVITPWDKSVVSAIEKAVRESSGNFNPAVDGDSVKVPIPALTEEQRGSYVKLAKEKLEEAKISVRNIRQNAFKALDEQEDNGVISEDEKERQRKAYDDAIKSANDSLQKMFSDKEKELMTV